MRLLIVILLLALPGVFLDDGEKEGRRGNEHYEQGSFGPAAEEYRAGLDALEADAPVWIRHALENNLGAALLQSGDAAGASEAFARALTAAPSTAELARTSYNAGNAAFAAEDLERALGFYRESLLREPDNLDAKFNYEFVKRRLDQQQQQQQQQDGDQQQDDDQQQSENSEGDQQQDGQQSEGDQQQEPGDDEQRNGDSEQQQGEQSQENEPEQSPQSAGEPGEKLSKEQAERILQALQNEEEQLLREVQRKDARPRQVEKDW